MARVGIAGLGFMGMIHYLAYQKVPGAKVVAMCEQDPVRLAGDWRSIKGNFGPPGQVMDLTGIARYSDVAALIADPQVDVVEICLPPAAHAEVTLAALRAGKHVFCEKPIALNGADARAMVAQAGEQGRLLFIGHVLPFFPEYQWAYRTVTGGEYGRLLGGHFKRIISDPLWLKDFYDPHKVGGPMLDLHIHDAHFIRVLCGMPRRVSTTGRMRGEVAEFFTSQFEFDDPGLSVTATSGVIQQQGRAFTHGFEIHLERATLLFDFCVLDGQGVTTMPVTLLTADGRLERPAMPSSDPVDAFVSELAEVQACCQSGRSSPLLDGALAGDALALCERQTESLRRRSAVVV
jgi:predicted dehydrogenase